MKDYETGSEGSGLESQERNCRDFAKSKGYRVIKVFKDKGVSGSLKAEDRPAMKSLLSFLDTQKDKYVVIVDHLDRVTRSMESKIELFTAIFARKALLMSPMMEFGQRSDQELVANVLASVSTFQRTANIEQVENRMKSRLLNGYWVFPAPAGYKYVEDFDGGKIMVRNEPIAGVITEALEGFAVGRFESQVDVAQFLEKSGKFPTRNGRVHSARVKVILTRITYTGYLEYPKWDVSLRPGKHPALIDMRTFERNQERLGFRAKAPQRKDIREDFPLRGVILCAYCKSPMTAAWATGRSQKYPYYRCKTKECKSPNKSIKRDRLEEEFDELLKGMKPSPETLDLVRDIVTDCWKKKKGEYNRLLTDVNREKKQIDQQIAGFMKRLLETHDSKLISLYENHIMELERKSTMLAAHSNQMDEIDTSYEGAVGTVFDFIGNPHSLWENGDFDDKRLVLTLTFAQQMPFDSKNGFGTAEMSLPFSVMKDMQQSNCEVVERSGVEPLTSTLPVLRSTN